MRSRDWSSDVCSSDLLPLDGNIGVRVIKTSNDAAVQYVLTYRDPGAPTTDINITSPLSGSKDYTEVLPSLNLRYHITDTLQARFAASRGHSRQQFYDRSEEHTSELQSLMRISYAVFCLKKKINYHNSKRSTITN